MSVLQNVTDGQPISEDLLAPQVQSVMELTEKVEALTDGIRVARLVVRGRNESKETHPDLSREDWNALYKHLAQLEQMGATT